MAIIFTLGVIASILLLLGFIGASSGKWSPKGLKFLLTQILGSLTMTSVFILDPNYVLACLELAFAIFGIYELSKCRKNLYSKRGKSVKPSPFFYEGD